jgi:thiol-disulfide isomerase/thioredoxin
MMAAKGTYEVYSADKLALAQDGKVVLFFKASWCPTCKAVDADIFAHVSAIPSGTHILIVDYDTSAELKKKYGVTYQHTFVQVDAKGAMLKKWSGSPTLASLVAEIK